MNRPVQPPSDARAARSDPDTDSQAAAGPTDPSTVSYSGGPAVPPGTYPFLTPAAGPGELGRLGPYRVLRALGGGGMGLVFVAEEVGLQRLVALKVIRPDVATDVMKKRFAREARTAAKVENDHIVTVFRVDQANGVPYLAMQLLRGRPLGTLLGKGPLPAAEAARIGREIALGLAAAHAHGLVHRDIKPNNLWLEEPSADDVTAGRLGRVKVLDFGLARPVEDDGSVTATNTVLGTPGYMAPEQAEGEPLTAKADVFSLGCVLYHLATGRAAYRGKNAFQLLAALVADPPPPATAVNPAVPGLLSDLIARLLARSPADRPTAAEAAAELRAFTDASSSYPGEADPFAAISSAEVPKAPPPRRPPARKPWLLPALIGGAVAVLVAAGFLFWKLSPDPAAKNGTVALRTDAPAGAAKVVLSQGGKKVAELTAGGGPVSLAPGRYEVTLEAGGPAYELATPTITVATGDQADVLVRAKSAPPVAAGPWPPAGFDRLPPAEQFRLVGAELARRNPGFDPKRPAAFDRKLGPDVLDAALAADTIPFKDLGPLAVLPKLSQVSVRTAGTVNLTGLKGLPLTYLELGRLSALDLRPLGTVPTLRHLTLDRVAGADLNQLSAFPGLRSLALRGPGAELTPLKAFAKELEELDLDESGVADLAPLAALTRLRTLKFRKCDVTDVSPLAGLAGLEEIECDYRPAFGPVFEKLPKLRRINGRGRDEFLGRSPKE